MIFFAGTEAFQKCCFIICLNKEHFCLSIIVDRLIQEKCNFLVCYRNKIYFCFFLVNLLGLLFQISIELVLFMFIRCLHLKLKVYHMLTLPYTDIFKFVSVYSLRLEGKFKSLFFDTIQDCRLRIISISYLYHIIGTETYT